MKQLEWKKIWQYKEYRLWCVKYDARYLYNVTKTNTAPTSNAGYFGLYSLLRAKNIPIWDKEIRDAIDIIIEENL